MLERELEGKDGNTIHVFALFFSACCLSVFFSACVCLSLFTLSEPEGHIINHSFPHLCWKYASSAEISAVSFLFVL